MRHRKLSQRLSRPEGHRHATLRNLVINLFKYQRIKTTKVKAREARSLAEHLISIGKQNTVLARRQAFKILANRTAVSNLFSGICPLFNKKKSGFTRIIHLPTARHGDGAEMVLLELTEKSVKEKPKEIKKEEAKKEKPQPKSLEKAPHAEPEIKAAEKEIKETEKEIKAAGKIKLPKDNIWAPKELKPKKFLGGLRRLFKKERDSL